MNRLSDTLALQQLRQQVQERLLNNLSLLCGHSGNGEICGVYKPLYMAFTDYEKAFYSVDTAPYTCRQKRTAMISNSSLLSFSFSRSDIEASSIFFIYTGAFPQLIFGFYAEIRKNVFYQASFGTKFRRTLPRMHLILAAFSLTHSTPELERSEAAGGEGNRGGLYEVIT